MKKLSAVQLKQQALVFSVADSLEAQALEVSSIPGVFTASLSIRE